MGYSPWGCKESDMTERPNFTEKSLLCCMRGASQVVLVVKNPSAKAGDAGSIPGLGRPLEKEMATHSSILAWEIPWTEEPGELQSLGLLRVGHD